MIYLNLGGGSVVRRSSVVAICDIDNTTCSRATRELLAAAEKAGAQLFVPPLRLCGDNAAMIGCQGYYEFLAGHTAGPELNAYATMPLEKQIG